MPGSFSPIAGLLFPRGPFAIGRAISFAIVNSIKCFASRSNAHIGKEVLEPLPSFANGYPTATIVFVFMIIFVVASIYHASPRIVLSAFFHAMSSVSFACNYPSFDFPASTRFSVARANIACGGNVFISAIATEQPVLRVEATAWIEPPAAMESDSHKAPISLTRCHGWEFSARSHFSLQTG